MCIILLAQKRGGRLILIKVIFGEAGAGKTKRIIDIANETLKTANGSIVFVDSDKQYMYDLKNAIRFVDASEFHIDSPKMFFGFISGLAAQDFDLEYLFIDGFLKIVRHPLETLEELFKGMEEFADRCDIKLVVSVTGTEEEAPDFLKTHIMK